MSTPSQPPFRWDAATLKWTTDGYVLTVPMFLDARATQILGTTLPEIPGSRVDYAMPATGNDIGELRITTREFFEAEPWVLRNSLNDAAIKARGEAEKEQARDDERIASYLARLRSH